MSTRLHAIARPRSGYHADLEEARMRTRRQHAQNEARRAAMEGSEDRRGDVRGSVLPARMDPGAPRQRDARLLSSIEPGRRSSEPSRWRLAWHALRPATWRFVGSGVLLVITLVAFHLAISNLAAGSCLLLGGACLVGVGYTAGELRGYVPRWTRKGQR